MGLFGSKDEINIRISKGKIKSICGRSFMGGSDFEERLEGDTLTFSAFQSSGAMSSQLLSALGDSYSIFGASSAHVSVTRYGQLTVELYVARNEAGEKQQYFPGFQSTLEAKGYDVFYKNQRESDDSAMISVSTTATPANWESTLTTLLNDVSICIIKPLQRV
jgi:hypothetical protein